MRTVDVAGLETSDDHPPRIMGVLNVPKGSLYEPSVFSGPSETAEYVDHELINEGTDIVDIGPKSMNKCLGMLSAEDGLDRPDTALSTFDSVSGDAVFFIEARHHEVAEAIFDGGLDMVNDICGFADPVMPRVCEEFDVAAAKMASSPNLTRPGIIEEVDDIYDALELNNFTDKTVLDPALGGWSETKALEHNRGTFDCLRESRGYGYPILVSVNRKSFLRDVTGRSTEEALPVSLATMSMAVGRDAHVVRTHDMKETRDVTLISRKFERCRVRSPGDVSVEELDVATIDEVARHLDRIGANRDLAAKSVMRASELGRFGTGDREVLEAAAGNAETVLTAGDAGALLVGTPAAPTWLLTLVTDASDALRVALEAVERTT